MTAQPKWMRRPRQDDRCGQCGWRRQSGHAETCPTRWAALRTAEAIAESRAALMAWMAVQKADVVDVNRLAQAAAAGLSARARELGLEEDLPTDWA